MRWLDTSTVLIVSCAFSFQVSGLMPNLARHQRRPHTKEPGICVMAKLTNWKSSGQKSISLWFSYHILPRQYTYIHLVIVSYHIIIFFLHNHERSPYVFKRSHSPEPTKTDKHHLLRQQDHIHMKRKWGRMRWVGRGKMTTCTSNPLWLLRLLLPLDYIWTTQAYESQLQDLPHELITKECLVFTGICNRSKDIGYRKTP